MRLIRNFFRFFGEAFSSMLKNPIMTMGSVLIVSSCLFIFGVFIILTINANYLGAQIEEQCQLEIYIADDVTDDGVVSAIENAIIQDTRIKEYVFRTGKERFDNFKKGLSKEDKEAFSGVPDSVIGSSFTVMLKNIADTSAVTKDFLKLEGVSHINNEQELITKIQSATNFVKHISMWIVLIFAFISILIISNTIKLTLHHRKKEISIMKYVGATDAYIRGPFLIEGIFVGLISAALAFVATYYSYNAILSGVKSMSLTGSIFSLEPFWAIQFYIIAAFAILGVGLGSIGSLVSIRKYLKV